MKCPRSLTLPAAALLSMSVSACDFAEQTRQGTRILLFSAGEPIQIAIDDQEAFELKSFTGRGVDPGEHTITVNGGAPITVTIDAFDKVVVPLVPNQCFMSLDVSVSHYDLGSSAQRAPRVAMRREHSEPFKLPQHHYFSKNDLPNSRTSGQQVMLLRSAPCFAADDLQLGTEGKVTTNTTGSVDKQAESVARLRRVVCKDKASPWCASLQGWRQSTSSELPASPTTYFGVSMYVAPGADDDAMAKVQATPSVLSVNPATQKFGVSSLAGETEAEKAEVQAAIAGTQAVLQRGGGAVALPSSTAAYLDSAAAGADQAFKPSGLGWTAEGGLSVRRVGDLWVSLEDAKDGGHFVSVHTAYKAE